MSTSYPKISIITAVFNGEKYLEETILSVLEQNYPFLEYIIIDGGSTDRSVDIIKKYESRLSYWISEKDNGMYHAIQKGFEKATGDIMAWINSDDIYHNKSFFTVAEIFSSFPQVHWIQGNPSILDAKGRTVYFQPLRKWSKYNYYLDDYAWIQQESTFWSRSLWQRAGGQLNTSLKYAGDFELWLRFFRHEKLYITKALLGGFRSWSNTQISGGRFSDYIKEVKSCLEKEPLSGEVKQRLSEIQKQKRLIDFTSRLNIGSLKLKYEKLFEYPPQIVFDTKEQKFELRQADGFIY